MNYVQEVEQILREECRRAGHAIDDMQARLYALLVLTRGVDTTLGDVHDAWAVGRNIDRPEHPDLVPFAKLSDETIAYDVPFRDAIAATARRLEGRS